MWELNYKESWVPKNWCFWTVVLEKTLESPLDCKEIQPVHPKGNRSWIFIGRTDAIAETPVLWPSDAKNWLIGKDPNAGKDWRWKEKGMTEDEMVGWHHRLDGQEFEQVPGVGDGQGSQAYCSPWGQKESDTTERLNWIKARWKQASLYGQVLGSWRKYGHRARSLRLHPETNTQNPTPLVPGFPVSLPCHPSNIEQSHYCLLCGALTFPCSSSMSSLLWPQSLCTLLFPMPASQTLTQFKLSHHSVLCLNITSQSNAP